VFSQSQNKNDSRILLPKIKNLKKRQRGSGSDVKSAAPLNPNDSVSRESPPVKKGQHKRLMQLNTFNRQFLKKQKMGKLEKMVNSQICEVTATISESEDEG